MHYTAYDGYGSITWSGLKQESGEHEAMNNGGKDHNRSTSKIIFKN